jgi:AraC family transcriptional regulator, positive regulator of tynA and feaB
VPDHNRALQTKWSYSQRMRTASWTAEATVGHADALGFGETIKLVWQLNGTMAYEDDERAFAIDAGELFLTGSSSDYCLNMSED